MRADAEPEARSLDRAPLKQKGLVPRDCTRGFAAMSLLRLIFVYEQEIQPDPLLEPLFCQAP